MYILESAGMSSTWMKDFFFNVASFCNSQEYRITAEEQNKITFACLYVNNNNFTEENRTLEFRLKYKSRFIVLKLIKVSKFTPNAVLKQSGSKDKLSDQRRCSIVNELIQ